MPDSKEGACTPGTTGLRLTKPKERAVFANTSSPLIFQGPKSYCIKHHVAMWANQNPPFVAPSSPNVVMVHATLSSSTMHSIMCNVRCLNVRRTCTLASMKALAAAIEVLRDALLYTVLMSKRE